jgi:hypothetical protein
VSQKIPGKTLAESLGLEIPDNAPGGQRMAPPTVSNSQRSTRGHKVGTEHEYEGFHDNDAYRRND